MSVGNIPSSGADLAAPLTSQSHAKPEYRGPSNNHDEMHPDSIIEDFKALHNNTEDETNGVVIYSSTE
jgi:hypothetical protein